MAKIINNTVATATTSNKAKGNRRRNIPESEVIRRKSRMIGSDDLNTAANVCRWAEQAGFKGTDLTVAEGLAKAFEAILALSQTSQHYEAAKKAKSVEYVLKRNDKVSKMTIDCRDGRKRKLAQVVSWFADRHFRIANDIAEAQETEARMAEIRKNAAEAKAKATEVISKGEKMLKVLKEVKVA